jgi:hypothetical protein
MSNLVILSMGDAGTEVFQLVDGKPEPVEHFVLDWDWAESDPEEFLQNLETNPVALEYVKTHLSEDWKWLQERIKDRE